MDLISRPCARCGDAFERKPDARGQAASWCAPCRRAYNREYLRDYGLRGGGGHSCVMCGQPCWGVRCKECYSASHVKKMRRRKSPKPIVTHGGKPTGKRWRDMQIQVWAEETHCGICGEYVDQTLKHNDKMSRSVDHIVPLSLGGATYDRSNLRLAHRSCNSKAGNAMRADWEREKVAFARAALWLSDRLAA